MCAIVSWKITRVTILCEEGCVLFYSFYLTLDHCYLRLSLWIVVLTRFGAFRVQMVVYVCWTRFDFSSGVVFMHPFLHAC